MGNDISCINTSPAAATAGTYITARRRRSRPLITIVSPLDGRACRFKEPLNVGELMLEVPGHFVAEFGREQDGYMLRSRRISALPADRNLCALHVYFVLPISRLNTQLATHEQRKIVMATRLASAYPAPYHAAHMHNSKINPLPSVQCEEAVMRNTKKRQAAHRRQALHRRQPVRTRTYRCQVLERDKQHRDQVEEAKGSGGGGGVDDGHQQRAKSKSRQAWIPKLDTIMELTLEQEMRK